MRLAAVLGVLMSGILGAPGDSFGQSDGPAVVDEFDGKLGLDWKPLHSDPTHVSLSSHPGELTITSQVGSMHRDAGAREIPPVRNLFLLDNPLAAESGFVVTTCLNSFRPAMPWQQAGLVIYNDDDNYLKWVCQSSRTGVPEWNLLREVDGQSSITKHQIDGDLLKKVWLRLVRRGDHYEYATGTDGKTFTTHGELPWPSSPQDRIGLVSKNGELKNATELEARFDSFEVRPLSPTEKKQASFIERGKLQGKWNAVACKLRGKELTGAPLSRFVFTDSEVTLTEGDKLLKGEYTVDAARKPKCILVSFSGDERGRSLSLSYQVERGLLTLCCDLRPGTLPPATLTSEEGDTRLLITLEPAEAAK